MMSAYRLPCPEEFGYDGLLRPLPRWHVAPHAMIPLAHLGLAPSGYLTICALPIREHISPSHIRAR